MTGIKELAYVVYQVSDLMDWEHFGGVTLLGMQFGHKTPNGSACAPIRRRTGGSSNRGRPTTWSPPASRSTATPNST